MMVMHLNQITWFDSFRNFLASFGTEKDKSRHQLPYFKLLDPKELHDLYRSDWMSRR